MVNCICIAHRKHNLNDVCKSDILHKMFSLCPKYEACTGFDSINYVFER